jgi:hypothetical protein
MILYTITIVVSLYFGVRGTFVPQIEDVCGELS